ncbi:hypothetical protein ASF27_12805 [Methylobacterium sp. Leaf102]|uniref:DUF3016 domain-containing protein n=1 Tax=Methylobacterium sp. Leaf102 TaxID=1736253 RepID=UPI0006F9ADAB|nr:DUF3016 domain-containing protein [Methylobacterium sp. Leaf102]KQP23675.1 hypothetical protein ASF27_12805 [Methylobacterium sp. Leaf102]
MRAGLMLLTLALTLWTNAATAQVTVRFIEPERYTDAENRFGSGATLRVTLGEIRRIFEGLATRGLPPGRTLAIDVLDIDLAGIERPGANVPFGLRVVSDISPPRFRLHYVLTEGRRRLAAAEETVTDINFLSRASRFANGAFDHERDLLRDWFRRRIVEGRSPTG